MTTGNLPGDGERAAMLGYVPQYEIAAQLIYDALLDGILEWIRVADPGAGYVDDIQIATSGCLDAYQVKWAEFTKDEFSYKDFIRPNKAKPSLYMQLAQGWKTLKDTYPDRDIRVHLIHKQVPNANPQAKLPVGSETPKHNHFQGFLKDCWLDRSWCKNGVDADPTCWSATLKDLKTLSNLDNEFLSFVESCELSFNYRIPGPTTIESFKQGKRKNDIDKIYNLLTKMAGGEQRIIELSKDELLEKLSWGNRFKHRFIHEFPIDQAYCPISETVNALETCLTVIDHGYVALLGSPGSGKSTALTHTLKYKKGYRLIRYYAFIPDSPYQGRGEAHTFLHDITLSLNKHGFHGEKGNQSESREELQVLLGEQLQQANQKWHEDGVVTLIMVDGLDHIQREQNPLQSLLSDLPHPSSIPDGVVFILGTQTLELNDLSNAIKAQIESANRTIVMSPLSRQNVYSVIDKWPSTTSLTDDDKEAIYEKSAGHPLSLIYLMQLIVEKSDISCSELLETVPVYQGDIELSYLVYWKKLENNRALVELLALLSRTRVPINTHEIEQWTDASTIRDFILSASHYFRKESKTRWQFFHNSFRQFILDKTGRSLFNNYDESKHILYHKTLADLCSKASQESSLYCEQIYHLFNAKKWDDVLTLGQQDYLRQQFFNLRHFDNILDDITYILLAAKQLQDPLAIVRCLLIETELIERRDTIDQVDILNLLYSAEGANGVLEYIFDGRRLRISDEEALKFTKVLIDNGAVLEAKQIFDAAEPLAYLSGSKGIETTLGASNFLKYWVDIAHYFISFDEVVSAIRQTRYEQDDRHPERKDEDLHFSLIRRLISSIYSSKDEEEINSLIAVLSAREEFYDHLLDISFSICTEEYPSNIVYDSLERVLDWAKCCDVNSSNKILIAELIFKINADNDAANRWLENIEQPELYKYGSISQWNNLTPFADRIRINRLKSALGCQLEPTIAVPSTSDPKYQGNVIFERHLVRFANIWGKAWAQDSVDPSEIVRAIQPVFNLFQKIYSETSDWIGWYELERSAVDFYKFIIRVAAAHGMPHILALAEAFNKHWKKHYWPTDRRREIALILYAEGWSKDALIQTLDVIEEDIADLDEVHTRVTEYTDLAVTWAKIGEHDKSKSLLPKIIKGSFGIYHRKDRQFSHWISWLGRVADQYPELVQEDIRRFSAALVSLELSGRGRGIQEGARDLIAITTSWHIEYAFELVIWLFERKGLQYGPGLTGLLQGMLNRTNPDCQEVAIFTKKLLLPFEEYNPSELPELLAYSCHKYLPKQEAEQQVLSITKSISTNLLPSNRYAWWEGIVRGLRKAGHDEPKYTAKALTVPKEKHVTHEPTLILHTKEKITDEKARLQANSIESLLSLINSVQSTEYFRWLDLIKPHLDAMNVSQLTELYDLISKFNPQHNAVAAIANRFVEAGEIDKANTILASLLDSSDPKGWDLHWDGGSRQSTFKTLIAIDPEKWRPKALQYLVDDYIGEYRYPSSLIWSLEEIVDIIFEELDLSLLWREIFNHVSQLDDFLDITELPPLPPRQDKKETDADYLVRFAFKLFDIPIPELQNMAHQAIIEFVRISRDKSVLSSELEIRLSNIGLPQVKALSVLKGVVSECADFVTTFKSEISTLSASNDFCIRTMALDLASILSIDAAPISEDRQKLPFSYEIELPELENDEEAIPYTAISPGETFPDMGDPLEMIRPLSNVAELMARISDIPIQNIVTHASNLMRTLVPEATWNKVAEEKFRAWMKGIDLELTYHRLRPQIAKLALSHVACELLDAGRVPPEDARFLEKIFNRSDSYMLPIEPIERPSFIVTHNAKDRDQLRHHDEWLQAIREALPLFRTSDNHDRLILGELTSWCWLDWEKPIETRLSMVCHSEWQAWDTPHDAFYFFPHKMHWTAEDYPNIRHVREPSLVIYGALGYVDLGGTKWLALNPVIGYSLGWSVSSDGLFRWVDDAGNVMVESIYWKDGPIGRQPPKMDDICSDGWLVVAAIEAVGAIRQLTGKAIKINAVVRKYGKNPYELKYEAMEIRNQWG